MNWWILAVAVLLSVLGIGRNRYLAWAKERDRKLAPRRILIPIDESCDLAALKAALATTCPEATWEDHIEPTESGPQRYLLITAYTHDLRLLPAITEYDGFRREMIGESATPTPRELGRRLT